MPEEEGIVSIFFCYASEDIRFCLELEKQLVVMRRQKLLKSWYGQDIRAGDREQEKVQQAFATAQIVLLMVSPDLLASEALYEKQIKPIYERWQQNEVRVIPIILRHTEGWEKTEFGGLASLPRDKRPVSAWESQEEALYTIASEIRIIVEDIREKQELSEGDAPIHPNALIKNARPERNYIPFVANPGFQERDDQYALVEGFLLEPEKRPARVGLVGIPGSGKRKLAARFAQLYQIRFPDGVFWVSPKGSTIEDWQRGFADLASHVNYRPANNPNDEVSLAAYMVSYLANHPGALLILENVDNPALVRDLPPRLAGEDIRCAILYTSTNRSEIEGIKAYRVPELPRDAAYNLLLDNIRPETLAALNNAVLTSETQAAAAICKNLNYHPMMLDSLRALLYSEPDLTLNTLVNQLKAMGALDLIREFVPETEIEATLLVAFHLLWEKVKNEAERNFFKLAVHYPQATAIPLWLLGLATGLETSDVPMSRLRSVRQRLDRLSLIDYFLENQAIQLHPLIRDFGQKLVTAEGELGREFLKQAGQQLADALTDLALVRARAREDYRVYLDQLRETLRFIENLAVEIPVQLQQIERYMDQESHLLASPLWPDRIPALFHQKMHNRAFEDEITLREEKTNDPWLRQLNHVRATTLRPERTFAQHIAEVTGVAFSPDGSEVLTGSQDATARLTEAMSGRSLAIFKGHLSGITSVAFSPDGNYVFTGSEDRTARLWFWNRQLDQPTPTEPRILQGHSEAVNSVAFSHDGKYLLTGSQDKTARLWDRETGMLLQVFVGHQQAISGVAFSPRDGRVLTGSWDNTVRLWDQTTGATIKTFGFTVERQAVMGSVTFVSQLKNAMTGEIVSPPGGRPPETGRGRIITCIAVSHDGKYLLTGSNDATARLWEIDSGKIVQTFSGHSDDITSVAFSPDDTRVVTGSSDGTARVWETTSGNQLMLLDLSARVDSVAFSPPNGAKVLTGSNEKLARLWDVGTLQRTINLSSSMHRHRQPITSVALARRSDGAVWCLTGSEDKTAMLWVWDMKKRESFARLRGHRDIVTSVALSHDGRRLLTADARGQVYVWGFTSARKPGNLLPLTGHTVGISSMCFSPDGQRILTASWDGTTRLWRPWLGDVEERKHSIRTYSSPSDTPVETTAFSATDNRVLTGMIDGSIGLWVRANNSPERIWKGHDAAVVSVAFSPDGSFLLSSGQDEKTYLWSASGEMIGQLEEQEKEIAIFAFSPNGKLLLTCDRRGGQVRLWKIRQGSGEVRLELCCVYDAYHRVGAVLWLSDQVFLLADMGGSDFHPFYYQLMIENPEKLL